MRPKVSLRGRLAKPLERPRVVLLHAEAEPVDRAHGVLRNGVPLLRFRQEKAHRLVVLTGVDRRSAVVDVVGAGCAGRRKQACQKHRTGYRSPHEPSRANHRPAGQAGFNPA